MRGVINIGAPIFDRHGKIEAAIVAPYPEVLGVSRGPEPDEVRVMVQGVARAISTQLGYLEEIPVQQKRR